METNFWDVVCVAILCGMFCYFAYLTVNAAKGPPRKKEK